MPNQIKPKIVTVIIAALLIIFASPAQAQAPKISKELQLQTLALHAPKEYARIKMAEYGWYKQQHLCLTRLWGKESGWNHKADNPHSSAFGIAQMLKETAKHPLQQINNGLRYIKHRYDEPCNAWKFWRSHKWY